MHDKLRSLTTVIALTAGLSMSAALHAQAIATPPATTVVVVPAPAAEVKPPAEPYTLTGNFGIYSQYIFRGLTQTDGKPAFQGGFDWAHTNGFYLGHVGLEHQLDSRLEAPFAITAAVWNGTSTAAGNTRSTTTGAWTSGCSITTTRAATSTASPSPTRPRSTSPAHGSGLSFKYSDSVDDTFGVAEFQEQLVRRPVSELSDQRRMDAQCSRRSPGIHGQQQRRSTTAMR